MRKGSAMEMFPHPGTNYSPGTFGQRFALYLGTNAERVSLFYPVGVFVIMFVIAHLHGDSLPTASVVFWVYFCYSCWRNRQFMKVIRALDHSVPARRNANVVPVALEE